MTWLPNIVGLDSEQVTEVVPLPCGGEKLVTYSRDCQDALIKLESLFNTDSNFVAYMTTRYCEENGGDFADVFPKMIMYLLNRYMDLAEEMVPENLKEHFYRL